MRILHTMIRVGDLQRSIDFYTQVLGMKLLRKTDCPEQTLHQSPSSATTSESNARRCSSSPTTRTSSRYDLGTGYGHVAIEVPDAERRVRASASSAAAR